MMLTAAAMADGWHDDAWSCRQKITIDSSKVSGTGVLTNFPVAVTEANIAGGIWAYAQANGDDILFTKADGTSKLNHEVEAFDPGAGTMALWVNVPRLGKETGTVFYVYYGNPSAPDQANPTAVWNSDYAAVWHLSEAMADTNNPSVYKDSTVNTNHGGDFVLTAGKAGRIGPGQEFDGANDYVRVPHFTESSLYYVLRNAITMEAWANAGSGMNSYNSRC